MLYYLPPKPPIYPCKMKYSVGNRAVETDSECKSCT